MRIAWLMAILLAVVCAPERVASQVLINNGNDCGFPANSITTEQYADETVYVRNSACPPGADPGMACPPEDWVAATDLCVFDGGSLPGARVEVRDDALLGLDGGIVGGDVTAREVSDVFLAAGSIEGSLVAIDDAVVTILGGTVLGILEGRDRALVDVGGGSALYLWTFGTAEANVTMGTIDEIVAAYGASDVHVGGGAIVEDLIAFDDAEITLEGGGAVGELWSLNTSTIIMKGGQVLGALWAFNQSQIDLLGGYLHGGDIVSSGTSVVRVSGSDFQVDGQPVEYGPLVATTGVLRGTLASGQLLESVFYQGGGGCPYDGSCAGSIVLVAPAASDIPALPGWGIVALAAGLLGGAALRLRRGAPS